MNVYTEEGKLRLVAYGKDGLKLLGMFLTVLIVGMFIGYIAGIANGKEEAQKLKINCVEVKR